MTAQLDLALDPIEQAFADDLLRIEVDEKPRPYRYCTFVGCNEVPSDTPIRWVHVISIPAGGEIRGYVIVDGELRERGPSYMECPEMDGAVSRRLGMPVRAHDGGRR